ncbi:MAG: hypothetical protein GC162_11215 [Planctomycetes bacterium]|nr:hypothetical protein [Planctomycetota bacterium]
MKRLFTQFGDFLDRIDIGGWLMLLSGFVIVSATVLTPAWRDVRALDRQRQLLDRQVTLLELEEQNYNAFVRAVQRDDPLLLERLAWHHLRLRPSGSEVVPVGSEIPARLPSIAQWVQPQLDPLVLRDDDPTHVDSRLIRLITGPSRPWVLAFGGWLILMGLLLNPTLESAIEDDAMLDDEPASQEAIDPTDASADEADVEAPAETLF